jgi:hypothetical protein
MARLAEYEGGTESAPILLALTIGEDPGGGDADDHADEPPPSDVPAPLCVGQGAQGAVQI